jgi:hypothetical protein
MTVCVTARSGSLHANDVRRGETAWQWKFGHSECSVSTSVVNKRGCSQRDRLTYCYSWCGTAGAGSSSPHPADHPCSRENAGFHCCNHCCLCGEAFARAADESQWLLLLMCAPGFNGSSIKRDLSAGCGCSEHHRECWHLTHPPYSASWRKKKSQNVVLSSTGASLVHSAVSERTAW